MPQGFGYFCKGDSLAQPRLNIVYSKAIAREHIQELENFGIINDWLD